LKAAVANELIKNREEIKKYNNLLESKIIFLNNRKRQFLIKKRT
jgi:hypothetical protein